MQEIFVVDHEYFWEISDISLGILTLWFPKWNLAEFSVQPSTEWNKKNI